jgi:hypothetical protein
MMPTDLADALTALSSALALLAVVYTFYFVNRTRLSDSVKDDQYRIAMLTRMNHDQVAWLKTQLDQIIQPPAEPPAPALPH